MAHGLTDSAGDGGMFGFRAIFEEINGGTDTDDPTCHWTLSMYGDFYVTVFVVPAFQTLILVSTLGNNSIIL
jgi:hypothetical protein